MRRPCAKNWQSICSLNASSTRDVLKIGITRAGQKNSRFFTEHVQKNNADQESDVVLRQHRPNFRTLNSTVGNSWGSFPYERIMVDGVCDIDIPSRVQTHQPHPATAEAIRMNQNQK